MGTRGLGEEQVTCPEAQERRLAVRDRQAVTERSVQGRSPSQRCSLGSTLEARPFEERQAETAAG